MRSRRQSCASDRSGRASHMLGHMTSGRRARVAGLAAAIALLTFAAPAAATPDYDWPGMKKCGTFRASSTIYVYAKNITCKTARRIQIEFWRGPKRRQVVHNGGTGADGWITLKRYPRWRCTSGSGGGGCSRGNKTAGYQN
jgi:hypothetical protein